MSDAQAKLFAALASAQAELPTIPKDRTAKAGTYSYKYADINDILQAVRETLSKHGLAVSQGMDGQGHLITTIMHKDGGSIHDGGVPVPGNNDPQKFGSALTYMRRYGLSAMLGIAADEDVDGQGGEGEAPKPKERPKPPAYDECRAAYWSAIGIEAATDDDGWSALNDFTGTDALKAVDDLRAVVGTVEAGAGFKGLSRDHKQALIGLRNQIGKALKDISNMEAVA